MLGSEETSPNSLELSAGQLEEIIELIQAATERTTIEPFLLLGDGSICQSLVHMQLDHPPQTRVTFDKDNKLTVHFSIDDFTKLATIANLSNPRSVIGIGFAHPATITSSGQLVDIKLNSIGPELLDDEGRAVLNLMTSGIYPNLTRVITAGQIKDGKNEVWTYSPFVPNPMKPSAIGFKRTGSSIPLQDLK